VEQEVASQGVQGDVGDAGQRHSSHIVTVGEPIPSLISPLEGNVVGEGQFVVLQKKHPSTTAIYNAQTN